MNIKLYIAGTIVLAVIAIGLMKTSHAYDPQKIQKKGDNPNCRVTAGGALECDDEPKKDDAANCRVTTGGAIECDKKVKGSK